MAKKDLEEGLRLPPQDLECEQAVLGSCLMSADAIDVAMAILKPSHFYKTAHSIIYQAMCDLNDDGYPADSVTLVNKLTEINKLEKVGGAYYVTGLADAVPSAVNIEHYCGIVLECAHRRLVISVFNDGIRNIYEGDYMAEEAHASAISILDKMDPGEYKSFSDIVPVAQSNIETIHKEGKIPGMSTGFADLDRATGGLSHGELILLAGRPSMGKTALGVSTIINMAKRNYHGAVASIESSGAALATRALLQARASDDTTVYQEGYITEHAMSAVRKEAVKLAPLPIWIDDSGGQTIRIIRSRARRIKAREGLDILLVDYIQLLTGPKGESRRIEVGEYSRQLKAIAKELDIAVLAISQLSRAPEARSNRRPIMSDLKESGDLEQEADKIIFIYRPEVYGHNIEKTDPYKGRSNLNLAEVIIAKFRDGATGMVEMTFLKEKAQFFDRESQHSDIPPPHKTKREGDDSPPSGDSKKEFPFDEEGE